MDCSRFIDTSNFVEMMIILTDNGSNEALKISRDMLLDHEIYIYSFFLDNMGIRGDRLVTLYNKCCDSKRGIFQRTLEVLKYGVKNKLYSEEDILRNLDSEFPVPFINKYIYIGVVPSIGNPFSQDHSMWKKYCEAQSIDFLKRTDPPRHLKLKKYID